MDKDLSQLHPLFESESEPDTQVESPESSTRVLHEESPLLEPVPLDEALVSDTPVLNDSFDASTLGAVRDFSERIRVSKSYVEAGYPFHLRIDGFLTLLEQDKLIEFLSTENIGISPQDIEPQLARGRMLLPQISEYAAIRVVQLLRDSTARFDLRPSPSDGDTVPLQASDHLGDELQIQLLTQPTDSKTPQHIALYLGDPPSTAGEWTMLETISSTAFIDTPTLSAEQSSSFDATVEALKRDLRFKAHFHKADALIRFELKVHALQIPTQYQLIAIAQAIQFLTR